MCTRSKPEPLIDMLEVRGHRSGTDVQPGGNLIVAEALRHEPYDLQLAIRQVTGYHPMRRRESSPRSRSSRRARSARGRAPSRSKLIKAPRATAAASERACEASASLPKPPTATSAQRNLALASW